MTVMRSEVSLESGVTGCILGTAVADALGLACEGLSRRRLRRLYGSPPAFRFLPGRGMVSDDTEHTCLVAQALIASGTDAGKFSRLFARRFRWWFLRMPASVGRATAMAAIRLWFGASPDTSGVNSAGNGPAMRAAIIGAAFEQIDAVPAFVRASSRITHSDVKAEYGALAVAFAAHFARTKPDISPHEFVDLLEHEIGHDGRELTELLRTVADSVCRAQSTSELALEMGLQNGVTGYIYHTVPVVIHAWMTHRTDFRSAVISVIELGGDTDTTAAIVGGIIGAGAGDSVIPQEWQRSLIEWPMTTRWMRTLASQLADSVRHGVCGQPVRLNPVLLLVRNIFFLGVVLLHGLRRLLPPY